MLVGGLPLVAVRERGRLEAIAFFSWRYPFLYIGEPFRTERPVKPFYIVEFL
jgi:hypothetical protein